MLFSRGRLKILIGKKWFQSDLKRVILPKLLMNKNAMKRFTLYSLQPGFCLRAYVLFMFLAVLFLSACKKEGNAELNVYLTDAPIPGLDAVYLDIQDIGVNSSSKDTEKGWKSMTMSNRGAFNLLSYVNGKDTLLAGGSFPPGKLSQIRLIPGPDNRVVELGKNYTLSVTSILANGIRLAMPLELEADKVYDVWVDIDASRSLVRKPNNQFNLEPVARIFTNTETGAVSGTISPSSSGIYIQMATGTDTLGTIPNENGDFLIRGIQPGNWSLTTIGPDAGDQSDPLEVIILVGETNQLGTIYLNDNK
jgi:hypothetical protein